MGAPRRTPEELEGSALEAYRRYDEGESLREIAAAMSGPPHFCGGHTTARRWIRRGFEIIVNSTPGTVDADVRREARRRATDSELDAFREELMDDVRVGRLDRGLAHRLYLDAIKTQIHLEGLRRPPEPSTTKLAVSGTTTPALDPDLLRAIAAIPQHEWPLLPTDDEGDPER